MSLGEPSTRLEYNPQFMKTLKNKQVKLKVSTLLDFCDVVGISIQDFFYLGEHYNEADINVLELFSNLPDSNKQTIIDLMKKLK